MTIAAPAPFRLRLGALALAAAACAVSTAAHADELQAKIVAAAKATPADRYAFRRTLVIERSGAARKTIVEQFDPRRPPAARWSLVGIDGRAPTPKEIADARKTKRGSTASYGELAKWFGGAATRSEVPGGYLYRFPRLPAGTLKIGSHDASPDTQAEALVNTRGAVPFVERVRLASTKGFRIMLVASLGSMVVDQRYRLLGDGGVVPGDGTSELTGSMLGKSGTIRTRISYADITPVR